MAKKASGVKIEQSEQGIREAEALPSISSAPEGSVGLIPQEKLHERIQQLRGLTLIRNDKGEEVAFDGTVKEDFLSAFEAGYPVIERTLASLYDLGGFLHGVREKLKPHKLYHTWLDYAGIPQGTARNYLQAYERYGEQLPRFAPLGIKKLLIASRLPNCVEYIEEHEKDIAEQSAVELEKSVQQLRQRRQKKSNAGRKPKYFDIGRFRLRPSLDGTRLTIEGITETKQAELIEALKVLLSEVKD